MLKISSYIDVLNKEWESLGLENEVIEGRIMRINEAITEIYKDNKDK